MGEQTELYYAKALLRNWLNGYINGVSPFDAELLAETTEEFLTVELKFETDRDPGDEAGYGSGV